MKTPIEILEYRITINADELRHMNLRLMNLKNEAETLKISIYEHEMENRILHNAVIILKGAV